MKYKKIIIFIIAGVLSLVFKENFFEPRDSSGPSPTEGQDFILTKHAKCRMKCRHIDELEVTEVLSLGKINQRKSDIHKKPCPVYVKESRVKRDKQLIRVVYGQCAKKLKIITVIDLERNYRCHCN